MAVTRRAFKARVVSSPAYLSRTRTPLDIHPGQRCHAPTRQYLSEYPKRASCWHDPASTRTLTRKSIYFFTLQHVIRVPARCRCRRPMKGVIGVYLIDFYDGVRRRLGCMPRMSSVNCRLGGDGSGGRARRSRAPEGRRPFSGARGLPARGWTGEAGTGGFARPREPGHQAIAVVLHQRESLRGRRSRPLAPRLRGSALAAFRAPSAPARRGHPPTRRDRELFVEVAGRTLVAKSPEFLSLAHAAKRHRCWDADDASPTRIGLRYACARAARGPALVVLRTDH